MLHLIESEEAPTRPDNVHHANAISLSVTPMVIVWNCARHRDFSDEAPMVYVLTVERQALVPLLPCPSLRMPKARRSLRRE
jgi:hypothetical protein